MNCKVYTVKGFKNLNKEFTTLDEDNTVIDYEFNTIDRSSDDRSNFEYELQVIYK